MKHREMSLRILLRVTALFAVALGFVGAYLYFRSAPLELPGVGERMRLGEVGWDAGKNDATSAETVGAAGGWKPFTASEKGRAFLDGDIYALKLNADEIRRFLTKRGETAYNLLAAYESGKDPQWLKRAFELYPNDPAVLLVALGAKPGEPERNALVERWKAADPRSPLPWVYSAETLFAAGDGEAARVALREAISRPSFYLYTNERIASRRQMFEDSGLRPVEADVVATFGGSIPHLSIAGKISKSLLLKVEPTAESPARSPSVEDLRLAYELARIFSTPESNRFLINQITGTGLERRALQAIPADAPPDFLPIVPAQRLAEMDKQSAILGELMGSGVSHLAFRDEPTLTEYMRRLHAEGEMRAMQWMQAQPKPVR